MQVKIYKYDQKAPLFRGELLASFPSDKTNRGEINVQIEHLKNHLLQLHGALTVAILTD